MPKFKCTMLNKSTIWDSRLHSYKSLTRKRKIIEVKISSLSSELMHPLNKVTLFPSQVHSSLQVRKSHHRFSHWRRMSKEEHVFEIYSARSPPGFQIHIFFMPIRIRIQIQSFETGCWSRFLDGCGYGSRSGPGS